MMCLDQNKQELWYALYEGKVAKVDAHGNKTGQYAVQYGNPIKTRMNISAAKGTGEMEMFGINENYTRTVMTDDIHCPIKTDSVLWIDADPKDMPYNYRVVRVAKSINSITYAVLAVDVT